MVIEWNDDYSVNVKVLDEQHKKFINILDELYDSIHSKMEIKKINRIFGELLINYIGKHFATEEKYFAKYNYTGASEHIKEHRRFKEKLLGMKEKVNEDQLKVTFELIDFLEDWLVDHVNHIDKKYTKCFNEHGLF